MIREADFVVVAVPTRWTKRTNPISVPGRSLGFRGRNLKRARPSFSSPRSPAGSDRRNLHPDHRGEVRPEVEGRLFVGYSPSGSTPAIKSVRSPRSSRSSRAIPLKLSTWWQRSGDIITAGVFKASSIRSPGRRAKVIGKCPARPQYCLDERAGDHFRPHRHRYPGSPAGCRDQMEFPSFRPGLVGGTAIGGTPTI